MITLGIESSCDETSAAVLKDGIVLSNQIYSQKIHAQFGGVVPELASRAHIQKIDRLCMRVLEDAALKITDVNLVAVSDSPGLAGALLVGISFALGLHQSFNIPITGVNHLEGHICSVLLEHADMPFPFLALVVSGGHTAIYRVDDPLSIHLLGQTIDDAAGEAFDKVGKMLGFPYPAGLAIDQAALQTSADNPPVFPVANIANTPLAFSFSGLKTAVKYYVESRDPASLLNERPVICKAFQKAVVNSLVGNMIKASNTTGIRDVAVVGGVACNSALRAAMRTEFDTQVRIPSLQYCTDNAAMIARSGYERFIRGVTSFPKMTPTIRNKHSHGRM